VLTRIPHNKQIGPDGTLRVSRLIRGDRISD
jgi:hypothetical protein